MESDLLKLSRNWKVTFSKSTSISVEKAVVAFASNGSSAMFELNTSEYIIGEPTIRVYFCFQIML